MVEQVVNQYVEVFGPGHTQPRTTNQYLEVFGPGHTQPRVVNQYIEVLGTTSFSGEITLPLIAVKV